jgi:hypothetical protein
MARGGARPGAGRKSNAAKYTEQIARFTDRAANDLDKRYDAIDFLATGGFEEIEEVWKPAGLIQITKEVITKDGTLNVKELAFPHLDPEQLVCVERKRKIAAPDLKANQYLVDRILGKPTQAVELDADPDGALEVTAAAMAQAASELALWRKSMTEQLSSLNAPPTPPTAAITTV